MIFWNAPGCNSPSISPKPSRGFPQWRRQLPADRFRHDPRYGRSDGPVLRPGQSRVRTAGRCGLQGRRPRHVRVLRWVLEDGIPPGDSGSGWGTPGVARSRLCHTRDNAMGRWNIPRAIDPGPLYLLSSYVLSRNVGNYTGLYASDLMFARPNSGPQFDWPDLMDNAHGSFPNDRTHVAKAAVSYRLGFGATLGGFLTVASGTPRSDMAARTGTRDTGRSCVHVARPVGPPPAGRSTFTLPRIFPSDRMGGSAQDPAGCVQRR